MGVGTTAIMLGISIAPLVTGEVDWKVHPRMEDLLQCRRGRAQGRVREGRGEMIYKWEGQGQYRRAKKADYAAPK